VSSVCGGKTMQEIGKTRKNSETATRKLLYEFGPFRVDPQKRLLLQDGQPVPLTGKAFDILLALLECHGEILTKDELIGRVWPDTVVEEGNLGRNISSLRKALDESPDEHRYIVTLARRGYRFVADVRERWEENGIATGPAEVKPFPAPGVGALPPAGTSPRHWLRWNMVASIALLAVLTLFGVVVVAYRWARGRGRTALEPTLRQLTANPTENWVNCAAISPDGKYLAFLDRTGLYVRSIDSGETHPIAVPPEWNRNVITGLRWFPDGGKLIASVRAADGYDIWAITTVGQAAPRLIQRGGLWPAISPDGRSIVFQNGITTDGFQPYVSAITTTLSDRCDYAMQIKVYGNSPDEHRYSPGEVISTEVVPVMGNPDTRRISTSHVERQNLTIRMCVRRLTRLTNGFSKKWENLWAAYCLHFAWYNFGRVHQTLRVTPAMEANITNHIWELKELLA